jgi:hypothetical protein
MDSCRESCLRCPILMRLISGRRFPVLEIRVPTVLVLENDLKKQL